MKILVLCDAGNNRSVMVAHHLKYWGHDVIPAGLATNSPDTIHMLCEWADRIIFTAKEQMLPAGDPIDSDFVARTMVKIQTWDIGPDHFPRPFNPELNAIVKHFTKQHEAEYKPGA